MLEIAHVVGQMDLDIGAVEKNMVKRILDGVVGNSSS